jgi:DNA polymerase-1
LKNWNLEEWLRTSKKSFPLKELRIRLRSKLPQKKTAPQQGQQFDLFAPPGSGSSSENKTSQRQDLNTKKHWYQTVDSPLSRTLLLNKLLQQKSVCFDTETTSLDALQAELVGIAFSWEESKGYYLVLPLEKNEIIKILEPFKVFFEHPQIEKVGHNLKYDLKVLEKLRHPSSMHLFLIQ